MKCVVHLHRYHLSNIKFLAGAMVYRIGSAVPFAYYTFVRISKITLVHLDIVYSERSYEDDLEQQIARRSKNIRENLRIMYPSMIPRMLILSQSWRLAL